MEKNRENGIGVWQIGEDWVAAKSAEEAMACYVEDSCLDEEDAEELFATEVEDLDAKDCVDVESYENGDDKRMSWRELINYHAESNEFPAIIASENW